MYKLKNVSTQYLIENGFREVGDGSFVLHFPVFFYKRKPIEFCNALIFPEEGNFIRLSVINLNGITNSIWHQKRYDQAKKYLISIDKSIDSKMKKIGAKKYADK